MKKRILSMLLILLTLFALCSSAMAAGETEKNPGIYDVTCTESYSGSCTITPKTADGTAIVKASANLGTEETDAFYANAVKFDVAFTGLTAGNQYLILVLAGDSTVPTEDNIVYIDQNAAAADGALSFTVYPNQVGKGSYSIYLAAQGGTQLEKVASFSGYQSYKLGDVNDDSKINSDDALKILQHAVELIQLTPVQQLAADVNCDAKINSDDALKVLQYAVELITSFD